MKPARPGGDDISAKKKKKNLGPPCKIVCIGLSTWSAAAAAGSTHGRGLLPLMQERDHQPLAKIVLSQKDGTLEW
jgi:hypothetical protein